MKRWAIVCVLLAGCVCRYRKHRPHGGPIVDADVDVDSDTDGDADVDTDTHSDTSTDTPSDTDTTTETSTDTETDTSSSTDTDTSTSTDTDAGDADAGPDAGACNGKIGDPVPDEGAGHCRYDAGPDGGCEYVSWDNNPPASGMHCPFFEPVCGEHDDIVSRCEWVHNLEHGWVVLIWNCPGGSCDAELDVFRQMIDDAPVEPTTKSRILMTEDPELDSRFAAVAWDWVWEGDVLDLDLLRCFVLWHYGDGREGGPIPDAGLSIDAGGPICP